MTDFGDSSLHAVWGRYIDWLADHMNRAGYRGKRDWVPASVMGLGEDERMRFGFGALVQELGTSATSDMRRPKPLPIERIRK